MNHHPWIHPFGSNRGKGRVGNKAGTSRWGILGQINRSRRRPDPFLILASVPPPRRPGELGRPPSRRARRSASGTGPAYRVLSPRASAPGRRRDPGDAPSAHLIFFPTREIGLHSFKDWRDFFCQRKKRDRLRAPSATPR